LNCCSGGLQTAGFIVAGSVDSAAYE